LKLVRVGVLTFMAASIAWVDAPYLARPLVDVLREFEADGPGGSLVVSGKP